MRRGLLVLVLPALLAGCGSPPADPVQAPKGNPGDRYSGANYPTEPATTGSGGSQGGQ